MDGTPHASALPRPLRATRRVAGGHRGRGYTRLTRPTPSRAATSSFDRRAGRCVERRMRFLVRWLLRALTGLLVFAAIALGWAHYDVRSAGGPLPAPAAIAGNGAVADAPLRLTMINTASQPTARSGTLAGGDPHPDAPFVMSYPSFVLEWADGRLLLIDVGMTRDQALTFGKPLELLGVSESIVPHRSVADALGADAARVAGIIITHMHSDHTGGIAALCAAAGHDIPVFMTRAQAERPNYTTRPGLAQIRDAGCARPTLLEGGPLLPVPGFPGVAVIDAGGHTPGSQLIVAQVGSGDAPRRVVFTGDIVNNLDGIRFDIPKPWLYRTFVIPESDPRQQELRRFLKQTHEQAGAVLLVSHDQLALEAAGIEAWR